MANKRNTPTTTSQTWGTTVLRADPAHNTKDRNHEEYVMSNQRRFKGDINARGVYGNQYRLRITEDGKFRRTEDDNWRVTEEHDAS